MIDRYPLTIEDKRRIFFFRAKAHPDIAGWSSLVARRAHNPEVVGSNPAPATMKPQARGSFLWPFFV